jgi:hypothetical protein
MHAISVWSDIKGTPDSYWREEEYMEKEGGREDPGQCGGEPIKISGTPPTKVHSQHACLLLLFMLVFTQWVEGDSQLGDVAAFRTEG